VVQRSGDELKLVWPQTAIDLDLLETWDFVHFLVQPMDDANGASNTRAALTLAMERPRWRLSLQTHKLLGLR
jgi:7-carboxy-7-deazaguanine synthase